MKWSIIHHKKLCGECWKWIQSFITSSFDVNFKHFIHHCKLLKPRICLSFFASERKKNFHPLEKERKRIEKTFQKPKNQSFLSLNLCANSVVDFTFNFWVFLVKICCGHWCPSRNILIYYLKKKVGVSLRSAHKDIFVLILVIISDFFLFWNLKKKTPVTLF